MFKYLIISCATSVVFILTTFFIPFLLSLFTHFSIKKALETVSNIFNITGIKVLCITFCFNTLIFFLIIWGYKRFEIANFPIISISLSILVLFLMMSYSFILSPILSVKLNDKFVCDLKLSDFVSTEFKTNMVVRVVNCNLKNAYATGILPSYKIILLGKPLVDMMSDIQLKGIISHEFAHNKYNHVFKIYLVSLLGMLFNFALFYFFLKVHMSIPDGFKVALIGGLGGFINFSLLPGLFRKRFEYEADSFAANIIGSKNYEEALLILDKMTDGALTKGNSTHPTLKQRINNINGK